MRPDILNTIFALLFAVNLIAIFWALIMYFSEMGSELGKKEFKGLLVNSVTWLLILMLIFGVVSWVRGLIGF